MWKWNPDDRAIRRRHDDAVLRALDAELDPISPQDQDLLSSAPHPSTSQTPPVPRPLLRHTRGFKAYLWWTGTGATMVAVFVLTVVLGNPKAAPGPIRALLLVCLIAGSTLFLIGACQGVRVLERSEHGEDR